MSKIKKKTLQASFGVVFFNEKYGHYTSNQANDLSVGLNDEVGIVPSRGLKLFKKTCKNIKNHLPDL